MTNLNDKVEDPRVAAIYLRVVEKLKEVVREFEITQDELHTAGDFLNRLGETGYCRSLIDVGLAMTSVDVTSSEPGGTRSNLEGPFYRADSPQRDDGVLFEQTPPPGSPILNLVGRVLNADTAEPLSGAIVDIWQADHEGQYDLDHHHLAGKVTTDEQGHYEICTAVPRDYSDHDNDPIGELFRAMGRHNRRAAHIHCKIWWQGHCLLTTQLFIAGNKYLDSDYVEGAVSDDLIIELAACEDKKDSFTSNFDFLVRPSKSDSIDAR